MSDYRRLCAYYNRHKEDCDLARKALEDFDVAHRRSDAALMRLIEEEAMRRCDAMDPRINEAIREHRRKASVERERLSRLAEYNMETGEAHTFAQRPSSGASNSKEEATLVGRVEIAGEFYAKTTDNRGRSFVLYPWRDEMARYQGRAGWFWYNSDGRFRFAPLIGTKPPLIAGMPSAHETSTAKLGEAKLPMLKGDASD